MSKGFINVSIKKSGNIAYYLRENECLYYTSSENLPVNKTELLKKWNQIGENEIFGNKDLNIRGRHDAQVCKVYILTLPNSLNPEECAGRIKNIINKTQIKECSWTLAIHKGEKDGIKNLHAHLIVNERNVNNMKKDREMIKKTFLENLRKIYQEEFKFEFKKGKKNHERGRVKTGLFWKYNELTKNAIIEYENQRQLKENLKIIELTKKQIKQQKDIAEMNMKRHKR